MARNLWNNKTVLFNKYKNLDFKWSKMWEVNVKIRVKNFKLIRQFHVLIKTVAHMFTWLKLLN